MNKELEKIAQGIVRGRKELLDIWKRLDYYADYGTDIAESETLSLHVEDITLGYAIKVCLTYPSWLSKNNTRLSKMKDGDQKTELRAKIAIKQTEFDRVKSLKDGE